jgi:excisionase family DNA binding protein
MADQPPCGRDLPVRDHAQHHAPLAPAPQRRGTWLRRGGTPTKLNPLAAFGGSRSLRVDVHRVAESAGTGSPPSRGLSDGLCEATKTGRTSSLGVGGPALDRRARAMKTTSLSPESSRDPGDLLTAEEVAAVLRVTAAWVYAETRSHRIPHLRLGRYVRYRRETLDEWIAQVESSSTSRSSSPRRRSQRSPMSR